MILSKDANKVAAIFGCGSGSPAVSKSPNFGGQSKTSDEDQLSTGQSALVRNLALRPSPSDSESEELGMMTPDYLAKMTKWRLQFVEGAWAR